MDNDTSSWPMVDIEHPLANDVVYGRGGLANNHKGNKLFRLIVSEYKAEYAKCSRHEKTATAERLTRHWRAQSPPGRFLKLDDTTGLWYDVGNQARSKCSQLLREGPLKTLGLTKQEEEDFKRKVAAFKAKVDGNDTSLLSAPPAPEEVLETPPQKRPTREIKRDDSPCSVMDMPFWPVEDVEKAYSKRRPSTAISNFFEGLHLPGFPLRRPAKETKRAASISSETSDDKPPAKRPALNPLSSFFNTLVQDKMPNGPATITIVQDNASPSPVASLPEQDEEIVVFAPYEEENNKAPHKADRSPTPCTSNCAAPREHPIPPPRRIAHTKRERSIGRMPRGRSIDRNLRRDKSLERKMPRPPTKSIERKPPKDIFVNAFALDESEHSFSWAGFDDLEDDPVLLGYAKMCDTSNRARSGASVGAFSASSRASMDQVMEEMGSLHELFQQHCHTGNRATREPDGIPGLDDMDVDDMSLDSFGGDDSLDGGTRHTTLSALSIDSIAFDGL